MTGIGRKRPQTSRAALVWCGFGVLTVLATEPVWSRLLFGYEPTLYDLLSLRCFGG